MWKLVNVLQQNRNIINQPAAPVRINVTRNFSNSANQLTFFKRQQNLSCLQQNAIKYRAIDPQRRSFFGFFSKNKKEPSETSAADLEDEALVEFMETLRKEGNLPTDQNHPTKEVPWTELEEHDAPYIIGPVEDDDTKHLDYSQVAMRVYQSVLGTKAGFKNPPPRSKIAQDIVPTFIWMLYFHDPNFEANHIKYATWFANTLRHFPHRIPFATWELIETFNEKKFKPEEIELPEDTWQIIRSARYKTLLAALFMIYDLPETQYSLDLIHKSKDMIPNSALAMLVEELDSQPFRLPWSNMEDKPECEDKLLLRVETKLAKFFSTGSIVPYLDALETAAIVRKSDQHTLVALANARWMLLRACYQHPYLLHLCKLEVDKRAGVVSKDIIEAVIRETEELINQHGKYDPTKPHEALKKERKKLKASAGAISSGNNESKEPISSETKPTPKSLPFSKTEGLLKAMNYDFISPSDILIRKRIDTFLDHDTLSSSQERELVTKTPLLKVVNNQVSLQADLFEEEVKTAYHFGGGVIDNIDQHKYQTFVTSIKIYMDIIKTYRPSFRFNPSLAHAAARVYTVAFNLELPEATLAGEPMEEPVENFIALYYFHRVLDSIPDDETVILEYSHFLSMVGAADVLNLALIALERVNNIDAKLMIANIRILKEEFAEAEEAVREVLKVSPKNEAALNFLRTLKSMSRSTPYPRKRIR